MRSQWNMQIVEVDGVRCDSYAYAGYNLHRVPDSMDWMITKRNWVGHQKSQGTWKLWAEARDRFNEFTGTYISDNW